MDRAALRRQLEELERQEYQILLQKEQYIKTHMSEFFSLWAWQVRAREAIEKYPAVLVAAPNKIGKTALGANIIISWALGYEPWSKEKSSLGIEPPVKIRISGEDWKHHIGQTLVPELKKWAPAGEYTTKKNESGIEYLWTWRNGSTFEIITYVQKEEIAESWLGHGWWPDEPPPQSMYASMSRGIFTTGGKVFMTTTPLKEAWMLDELVLSGRRDIGIIDGLTILDNEVVYKHDTGLLEKCGLIKEQIEQFFNFLLYPKNPRDRGGEAERFLEEIVEPRLHDEIIKVKFLRFVKDCPLEDRPSRLFGQFKCLVGLVLREFKPEVHIIDWFEIPTDWPVVPMIDIHLNTEQAIGYYATDRVGLKYVVDETWVNLTPEQIADDIIRKKEVNCWNITEAGIDPLAKGDHAYVRNRFGKVEDSYTIIEKRLRKKGIRLFTASKDKDSGVRNLKDWLCGINNKPTVFFLEGKTDRHIFEVQRWVYDKEGKPKKENDHFMENWYRFSLTGTKYKETDPGFYPARPKSKGELGYAGGEASQGWMGV